MYIYMTNLQSNRSCNTPLHEDICMYVCVHRLLHVFVCLGKRA